MANIKEILSKMTLQEKIGQLAQYNTQLVVQSAAEITGADRDLGLTPDEINSIGSVLNFTGAKEMIEAQKVHLENDPNKIPMLFMMDVIHGYRTIYPVPLGLGASFDENLVYDCSRVAAKEAAASGVHVTFTPMVDYVRDARWGRVMETCGEDVLVNSRMGAAQVKAFQGDDLKDFENLATCVKHFAAYGGAEAGRDYNRVDIPEQSLREFYLPAYKACIDAGTTMVMPSFNTLNGIPALANEFLMKQILKDEWGFDGVVISDYHAVDDFDAHGYTDNRKETAKVVFKNGCDIEMCSNLFVRHLKTLVEEGEVSVEEIDAAVLRVLDLKNKLGLFENPYRGASEEKEQEVFLTDEHRAVVRRAAEDSAVLLKNDGILPISKNTKKIALIGPLADNGGIIGFWACMGRDDESVTVRKGIENLVPNAEIKYAKGASYIWGENSEEGFQEAIEIAKDADVVIMAVGEPQDYSGEGKSRAHLEMPGAQEALIKEISKVNKNVVLLTFAGRPLVLTNVEPYAKAILHMWHPGTEGGNAAANLLFGDANPSGKLTMSFPKATGQCPLYYNHPASAHPKAIEMEGIYQPYCSNYLDCGNLALFPFGHGLSYSNFVYESLELSKNEMTKDDKVTVKITIHNDSDRKGKETVLLFMRDVYASAVRPIQQLIDFKKVEFEAGERKTIEFTIDEPMLRFWNPDNEFVSEPGDFQISTGKADNLILTKNLELK
ncbi:MAG: glycoside hydrolase family 3 N-terminal domain-containing protein [Clostridia bacterium]|nr:glycoside hydrolase family 3 N-terminal domain-containing protein [Clostridia bacterium]